MAAIAEVTGLPRDRIDERQAFARYGIDSAAIVALSIRLGDWLGRPVPPVLFWRHSTVEALAGALERGPDRDAVGAGRDSRPAPATSGQPLAIVGMACRFPGASDLDGFWDLLCTGRDAVVEVPELRWQVDPGVEPAVPPRAGLLDEVDRFDASFFGMSPREAAEVDPQQRLMLELGWEALEDAGRSPRSLSGSRTGVFVGAIWRDYASIAGPAIERVTAHTATGQALNMVANRLSYLLGLQGPSMVVDTACSSSLVALHLACQSLWAGESELAVVGGVSLMLSPHTMVALTRFGGLSPDGRCKAFDASADGFGRGEGGGVVVLQPLARAIADGARIYGVVRATGINNDGPSNGLTAPNPQAQEDLLRQVCARAGVEPSSVGYVEAHGTGTALGDPIEASALGAVFGDGRDPDRPLRIGSVKTNIGHLEGAAGIAGFIKAALCVHHREVVPSLHFEQPNPLIPFDALGLRVPRAREAWPGDGTARAGVSSFGWGGTNAHVLVEEPSVRPLCYLEIAAGGEAEREQAVRDVLASSDAEIARRIQVGPAGGGRHRLAVAGRTAGDLRAALAGFFAGERRPGLAVGCAGDPPAPLAFVCSPQGGQYVGCGRDAMASEPAFRAMLAEIDAEWTPLAGWSLREAMHDPALAATIDDVEVAQPILFATQVALAAAWQSFGVRPDAVVGHSIGEVAACFVAGILDLPGAVQTAYHYSRLQTRIAGRGGMMVAERSVDQLAGLLAESDGRLVIAAHNGPRSTVLSGPPDALARALAALRGEQVACAQIRVNIAAHSPDVDDIEAELVEALAGIRGRRARCTLISTARGLPVDGREIDGRYFAENLRRPVLLVEALDQLLDRGFGAFVELSPNPVLLSAIRQTIAHRSSPAQAFGSLGRGDDERLALYDARAALFCRGLTGAIDPVADGAPDSIDETTAGASDGAAELVALSAGSEAGLRALAARTAALAARGGEGALADLGHSAGDRRAHHPHRLGVIAGSSTELAEALAGFAERGEHELVESGRAAREPAPVAFVFPGQGSQWLGMARELVASQPSFRRALEECDAAVADLVGWSVMAEIGADQASSRLASIDVVQPVLFSIQVALAAQWRAWGIEPDLVIGHSMGEVAAAHVAGALGLVDAVRIICLRSRLLRSRSGLGAMLVCELTMAEAAELIRGNEAVVSIAVSNSSRSTVLSGDPAALAGMGAALDEQKVFWRWVKVDVASHSPQMDPLREDLLAALEGIAPRAGAVAMHSTVDGEVVDTARLGPAYWVRNLREPVLFASAVRAASARGIGAFVELSPHPILLPAIEQELAEAGKTGAALPSLRRGAPERPALLRSLAALYGLGHAPRWSAVASDRRGRHVSLPAYPWQRESHWLEPAPDGAAASEAATATATATATSRSGSSDHPLLGEWIPLAGSPGSHVWSAEWDRHAFELFGDHVIDGEVVTPGAAFLEMMLAAGAQALGRLDLELGGIAFERALTLAPRQRRRMQTVLSPASEEGTHVVEVFAREAGAWVRHARALLRPPVDAPAELPDDRSGQTATSMDGPAYYQWLAGRGLEYGPAFRGIEHVVACDGAVTARFAAPGAADPRLVCDPRFVDIALQASVALLLTPGEAGAGDGDAVMSVAIDSVELLGGAAGTSTSHVRLREQGPGRLLVDVIVTGADGDLVLRAAGMVLLCTPRADRGPRAGARSGADAGLAAELGAIDPSGREARLESIVREIAAKVLKLAPERVRRDVPLRELGMDSILSLELRNRLAAR
ncbi:MAG TPA: acyltransferase domain-containing protein, partial [Kofleriaceae bacterium]|nr:acyltransferase domain-containing protein [Kofleriaceae bacterium]